jgi:hypothetical protein
MDSLMIRKNVGSGVTHIIHFVTRNIVAMEHIARGSDHFQVQIIQQHLAAHASIGRIHPDDGRLERLGDVIHLSNVSDLLVRKDLCLHNMELENGLDPRTRQHIWKRNATKALCMMSEGKAEEWSPDTHPVFLSGRWLAGSRLLKNCTLPSVRLSG